MLKSTLAFLTTAFLAIGGGASSLSYVLNDTVGAGAVTFGPWTAFRSIGAADADPYSRARISREGILALGEGEGLAFVAERDSAGDRLRLDCAYRIEGVMPQSRFWTMFAEPVGSDGRGLLRDAAIQSRRLIREPDNNIIVSVGPKASSGNWLQTSGDGAMRLVTTMYDFSLATQVEATDALMPRIIRTGCNV